MSQYKIPVDFTVEAKDAEEAAVLADLFLKMCYKELAKLYNITDYELPVGYPIESHCP